MSEPAQTGAQRAMAIEEQAASWLERRRYWDWSDADQSELDSWMAESLAHSVAYWRLEATLTRTQRLAAVHNTEPAAPSPRRWLPLLTGIAAALVISTVAAVSWKMLLQPTDRTYATGVGGHEVVSFADGTRIELNTDTVLRARMTTGQRTVWLDKGEAFFQVRHDAAHPFVVIAANHLVTDLGTKFLVRRDPGRLEVALLEGRVRFGMADRRRKTKSTLLLPGDVATATSSTLFVTRRSSKTLTNELSWRHRMLVFSHTTLADAADEFNRYNREKLIVSDPAVARLMIDGTFRTDNLQAFTEVAEEVFKVHIEADGDQIIISR